MVWANHGGIQKVLIYLLFCWIWLIMLLSFRCFLLSFASGPSVSLHGPIALFDKNGARRKFFFVIFVVSILKWKWSCFHSKNEKIRGKCSSIIFYFPSFFCFFLLFQRYLVCSLCVVCPLFWSLDVTASLQLWTETCPPEVSGHNDTFLWRQHWQKN